MDGAGRVAKIFDDAPVAMFFAVLFSFGRAEKHTALMMPQRGRERARGWVFTTSLWKVLAGGNPRISKGIHSSRPRIFPKIRSSIESWVKKAV